MTKKTKIKTEDNKEQCRMVDLCLYYQDHATENSATDPPSNTYSCSTSERRTQNRTYTTKNNKRTIIIYREFLTTNFSKILMNFNQNIDTTTEQTFTHRQNPVPDVADEFWPN